MYYLHCVDNILLLFYGYILKQCCLFGITFSSSLPPLSHCLPSMTYHLLIFLSPLFYQVREAWQTYELELINYQNKCKIIRGWDDLFTKVKEHINSVTAMKLSPYFKVSEQDISCCTVTKLRLEYLTE